MNMTRN